MKMPKPKLSTVGHVALFAVVAALLVVNATLLYGMQRKARGARESAADAAKPAELVLTILTAPECAACFNPQDLTAPLRGNARVQIKDETVLEYRSDEAVALIQKYGIDRVPTLLIKGEIEKAFDDASFVQNIGRKAEDGTLIVTNIPAPYVEVVSGVVKGLFTATYLTDKSCTECYDYTLHRQALGGLLMKPAEEKFVDRSDSEGRALIAKYKIESTPTVLIAGDLAVYPQFQQVWPRVGTVEQDGTHVFRAGQALMGIYHDLKTKKVVKPEPPKAETLAPQETQPAQ